MSLISQADVRYEVVSAYVGACFHNEDNLYEVSAIYESVTL
jgi:hypothetical protein